MQDAMMVQDDWYDGTIWKSWEYDGEREGRSGGKRKRSEKERKERRIQLGGGILKYVFEGSLEADG